MNQNKAVLCPNCRKLISDYSTECPHCGLKSPVKKQKLYKVLGSSSRSFTKTIITINIVFFVAAFLLPVIIPLNVPNFQRSLGILPAPSSQALGLLGWAEIGIFLRGDWWVLITAMFLHGGVLHILFNMLWVRDLAPQTEALFSPHKMIIIYVLSGVGGNLAALFTPVIARDFLSISMGNYPVVGASGAVFGLIGAIIAFGKKRGGFWGRQVVRQLGMWAAIMIAMGFLFPGISNAGHIGGFITGYLVGRLMPIQQSNSGNRIYILIGTGLIILCGYSFVQMLLRLIYIAGHL